MTINIKQIKSQKLETGVLQGHFIISNLLKGQGLTIGNTFRRILLSNVFGTSIVGINIPGVTSEFSSIYGLREDVFEFLLNLKDIILRSNLDIVHYGIIKIKGPGILTASAIHFNSNIQIINPNQYLATIYHKENYIFEIIALKNKGYIVNKNIILRYPNFLNIEAVYFSILNVNYRINFSNSFFSGDSLLLEITTNGSILPNEAIIYSSKLLKNLFNNIFLFRNRLFF